MTCDFCQSDTGFVAYTVPDSARGMHVWVCARCGLAQSVPKPTNEPRPRIVSISSGATWGNIRHGKGLRLEAGIPILEAHLPWQRIQDVLDVGANRGDFLRWLQATHLVPRAVGIEPDSSIVEAYRNLPGLTLHVERLERLTLPAQHFDFVYCSHTLEHADSAAAMLRQIHGCLKVGGYLFLEVPNLDVLQDRDTVEEFFIDKHRFHFNRSLLGAFLQHLGFRIVHGAQDTDLFNITFVLTKEAPSCPAAGFEPPNAGLAEANRALIAEYVQTLAHNRSRLKQVVEKIHWFAGRQKVAFWGAGRLFDALICHGGLEVGRTWGVVDEYLSKVLPEAHGQPIRRPEQLKSNPPDVIIVLARSSAAKIAARARSFGIRKIITMSDLLHSVV
jgi:SAM-dependent methyltransferase